VRARRPEKILQALGYLDPDEREPRLARDTVISGPCPACGRLTEWRWVRSHVECSECRVIIESCCDG